MTTEILFPLAALSVSAAVGLVAGVGYLLRDPKADEHDLSDYHVPAPVNDAPRSLARVEQLDRQESSFSFMLAERGLAQMREDLAADDILPPAPEGMNAGSPLYAETLFRQWFPESAEDTAARFLREIRDEVAV